MGSTTNKCVEKPAKLIANRNCIYKNCHVLGRTHVNITFSDTNFSVSMRICAVACSPRTDQYLSISCDLTMTCNDSMTTIDVLFPLVGWLINRGVWNYPTGKWWTKPAPLLVPKVTKGTWWWWPLCQDDDTFRVFKINHDIPICESVSPNSSYRWHSMDDKEYQAYLNRLESEKPNCISMHWLHFWHRNQWSLLLPAVHWAKS